jgi:general secretion pathway protein K
MLNDGTGFAKHALPRQRGVALITALLIAALVTVVAVAMASRQQLDVRRTGNLLESDQAYMYALGMEAWAAQVLIEDAANSSVDSRDEIWATKIPPLPVEGGLISGSLEDMQSRFNLNNLIDSMGQADQKQIRMFQTLLTLVNAAEPKAQLSPFVANRVADWIDQDLNALADGAEDLEYLNLTPPYRAANQFMASPSELSALRGVSADAVAALLPFVSALPEPTTINVNTAPELVLMSLDKDITPAIAETLVSLREQGPFEKVNDFVKKLHDDYDIDVDSNMVSVSSEYFLVSADAAIGRTQLHLYSLLARKGNKVTVVSRGIGTY